MSRYRVVISRSAGKEIEKLPRPVIPPVLAAIRNLGEEPRPHGCKKLKGHPDLFRIRTGDYRVVYSVDDKVLVVDVRRVGHRRDVYQ